MNDDSSTFEIPIISCQRLQPGIEIGFPDHDDEMQILSYSLPFCPEDVLNMCVDFCKKRTSRLPYSSGRHQRVRYTLKRKAMDRDGRR